MTFENIVNKLKDMNKYISTMESCTGGAVASSITDIPGASDILKFSAVTYSNEYKIKMGVDSELIDKYSVYSEEVACNMAYTISNYTNSNYGIGVTGKLNRADSRNLYGKDNIVFVCIYDKDNDKYYSYNIEAIKGSRRENKILVIDSIIEKLEDIL